MASMEAGGSAWMTKRMYGLSTPMPKAMVATITAASASRNCSSRAARTSLSRPAW
jgi:hypothetical protein